MISKQQTPKIRFTGFSEDWSNLRFFETLDSIVDFRGRTPKKIGLEWSEKGYVALSALNVKNGYIDFGLDNHFGDEELYQKWMGGKELVAGQVLFTTEAPMGNVAQVPDNKGYILSQRTIAFNTDSSVITNDFLAVLLRSPATFNRLESMTSGGTAKGVSQKSMAKLEVDIPSDLQEQTAIGDLFQNIDQAIALQRRKQEQTHTLKKSLLNKMFPKKGQRQPEIRLEGFSGDWIETELGDVSEVLDNLRVPIAASQRKKGKTPYYGANGIQGYIDGFTHDGEFVLIAEDGANDLTDYPVQYVTGRIWVNNHAHVVKGVNSILDTLFLMYRIKAMDISKYLVGGSRAKLNAGTMKKIQIFLPKTYEEQTAIGQFFKQLDDTLSLQAKQLKTLDNIKKALLAKMFV